VSKPSVNHNNDNLPIRLPIGRNDFGQIIEERLGFVDKSLFIKEVLDDNITEVSVITRPRRFGKTLNLSMLHYFLASEVIGRPTKGLFDGLKITQCGEAYMKEQGKHPVVFITFKDIKAANFELALLTFSKRMRDVYKQYSFLLESDKLDEDDKAAFRCIVARKSDIAALQDSLKDLLGYLHAHYGRKPWLLIDEYDSPIHVAYSNNYYEDMVGFLRGVLGAALKDNPYLKKAVVTGILRISKESMFSGVNNLRVYSILETKYGEYFGFTESEIQSLLTKGKIVEKFDEIRKWYNGYRFGDVTIYNPWSIANYLDENYRARPYWVNTSDNQLIKDLLKKAPLDFKRSFEVLINGGSVKKVIDGNTVFKYLENTPSGVWNLMLMGGYLKPLSSEVVRQGDLCELAIPNEEVLSLYQLIIEQWLSNGHGFVWYNDFIESLLTGKIDKFKSDLKDVVLQIVSYHDLIKEPEAFYHGLMLGFTASLHDTYEIKSNRESGLGRFDIMLIPKDSKKMGVVIELKIKQDSESLDDAAKRALAQIEDRKYDQEFRQRNLSRIIKVGIGFQGKEFALEYCLTA
jgi:hypothetical protein